MASTSLTRTVSVTGNTFKGTLSMWFKRSVTDQEEYLFENYETSGNRFFVRLLSTGQLGMETLQGSSTVMQINTLNQFFDVGSWYHIVVGIDSTLATAGDRVKVYINGVQQTSYNDETQPPQDQNMSINEGNPTYVTIGRKYGASNYFNGSMGQVIWIDGTQYAASTFGSTDSTSGEWKPNANPTATYGTNGFKLTFEDTSSLGDDTSGNTNDLATSGSPTPTLDCPSNNFATMNQLNAQASGYTITNGNLSITGNSGSAWRSLYGTIGSSSGKYYWEQKIDGNADTSHIIGTSDIFNTKNTNDNDFESVTTSAYGYRPDGAIISKNTLTSSWGATWTTGDVIGVALDITNSKIYFSKNGTWQASGDPTSGSTGTGAAYTIDAGITYTPATATYNTNNIFAYNFGNGYFGTTAVTSAGTSASTPGTFEYDVPTGYQPLTTKGLNV